MVWQSGSVDMWMRGEGKVGAERLVNLRVYCMTLRQRLEIL